MEQFAGRLPGELIPDPARRERYEEIVRNTIRDLYGNARYWEFFQAFNEESIHDFISEYAARKAWYLLNGERMIVKQEKEQFQYRDLAEKCFWEIQQKKLFNLQAEWRAGLIELDQIEVTRDFFCWEKAITKCSFLEPVTIAEYNLYMDYVASGKWSEKSWLYNWQDYETYKYAGDISDVIPSWYRYYDSKRGTDYLLLLEDKKGTEEKNYIKSWKSGGGVANAEGINEEEFFTGPGPELRINYESLDFFIRTFEERNVYDYFLASEKKPDESVNEAEFQEALRILNHATDKVRLPENADWKKAIINGAKTYKTDKIISHLPFVYDEYLFRLSKGIAHSEIVDETVYQEYVAFTSLYRQQVQEGKKRSEE